MFTSYVVVLSMRVHVYTRLVMTSKHVVWRFRIVASVRSRSYFLRRWLTAACQVSHSIGHVISTGVYIMFVGCSVFALVLFHTYAYHLRLGHRSTNVVLHMRCLFPHDYVWPHDCS